MHMFFKKIIAPGDKILWQYLDKNIVVKKEVTTIASIKHYSKDLYLVTFKEPHIKGSYGLLMNQLKKMKENYDTM